MEKNLTLETAATEARQLKVIKKQQTLVRSDFSQPQPEVEHIQKERAKASKLSDSRTFQVLQVWENSITPSETMPG